MHGLQIKMKERTNIPKLNGEVNVACSVHARFVGMRIYTYICSAGAGAGAYIWWRDLARRCMAE